MTYDGSPLTFYDQSRGLNLVIGFKLQDNDARGDERRYGLILTIDSPDHASAMKLLSRHWEFVNYSFNKVIQYTKQQREDELRRRQISESYGEFTPMAGSYLRGNKLKIPRNLAYLTNDDLLFVRLHKWNTYMLDVLNMDE